MRRVPISVLLSALILAVQGYAQNITGSISGRVVDPSGAAIPEISQQVGRTRRTVQRVLKRVKEKLEQWRG